MADAAQVLNDITGAAVFTATNGRQVHVLFDIEAVSAVESLSGKSVFDLLSTRPGVSDMVHLIMAGAAGYSRRNPAAKAVNAERALRFIKAFPGGVLGMLPTMLKSLTKAEGLGLDLDDDDDLDDDEDGDAGPPGRGPTS